MPHHANQSEPRHQSSFACGFFISHCIISVHASSCLYYCSLLWPCTHQRDFIPWCHLHAAGDHAWAATQPGARGIQNLQRQEGWLYQSRDASMGGVRAATPFQRSSGFTRSSACISKTLRMISIWNIDTEMSELCSVAERRQATVKWTHDPLFLPFWMCLSVLMLLHVFFSSDTFCYCMLPCMCHFQFRCILLLRVTLHVSISVLIHSATACHFACANS